MSRSAVAAQSWVGNRLPRREDPRMLRGAGRFTGDIPSTHGHQLAFARSPVAAGTVTSINTEQAQAMPGVAGVFTSADFGDAGLIAMLEREEFIATEMPLMAHDTVRYAGEPVAVVVATDRYLAEDAAEAVEIDIDETEAFVSLSDFGSADTPVLHREAPDGVLVDLQMFTDDLIDETLSQASLVLDETFSNGRSTAAPMETRACLADWVERDDQLVIEISTQVPHQVRGGVAQGLASALLEELVYSPEGQPQSGTFMDYLKPTASEVPNIAIHHLETPCDQTETGAKGMGEGGAIGAPAAVVSGINDALRAYGADIDVTPVRPVDVLDVIDRGTGRAQTATGQELT